MEKCVFDPFLTHFWSQNSASSRHFGIFGGPKWATPSSKQSKNTCFSITHGLGSFLRKVIFLPLLDPIDPFRHPPVWASACNLPQPTGLGYGGLGVHLGNFEGWKPQNEGGCGWIRCPRNRVLSHVAKDMAYSWFCGCRQPICTKFGACGGLFGTFPGHMVESEGRKWLVDKRKPSRTWSAPTLSLSLAVLNGF